MQSLPHRIAIRKFPGARIGSVTDHGARQAAV